MLLFFVVLLFNAVTIDSFFEILFIVFGYFVSAN